MFNRDTIEVSGDDSFLVSVEQGTALNSLKYCRVVFDASKVSNSLFERFEITLPSHISTAVTKRRAEYLAGRICCKLILKSIGLTTEEVLSHYPDRAPVWPEGLTGSISHCASEALAVMTSGAGHVGIDVEGLSNDLIETYAESFTSADERLHLKSAKDLTIAFSAKESLFKALYPRLKFYFGFECASVEIMDASRFKISLTCSLSAELPRQRSWIGHYAATANTVTTIFFDPLQ